MFAGHAIQLSLQRIINSIDTIIRLMIKQWSAWFVYNVNPTISVRQN